MSSLQVTYPESPILAWNSSLSLTVSGYSEDNTSSIYINGSSGGVTFNPDKSWLYPYSIVSYSGNLLSIESKDSDGNIINTLDFDLIVQEPILNGTQFNTAYPELVGKTSNLASQVEISLDSFLFSDVTNFTPSSNDFTHNFVFTSPTQEVYLRAKDSFGQYSGVGQYTLNYKLMAPEIFSFTNPATSIQVTLSGNADYETESFIFSPDVVSTSGTFASGKVSGSAYYTEWQYSFTILSSNQNFTIKSVDIYGEEGDESSLNISYELPTPEIIEPISNKSFKFNETIRGTCGLNSKGVLYSSESSFNKSKIVSSSGDFYISGSVNDTFNIIVDNETRHIILAAGLRTTVSIVSEINSYFSKIIAIEESNRIIINENRIEILIGTSNSTLGFEVGKYNISYEFSLPPLPVIFTTRDYLDINLDGSDYKILFSKESVYTEEDIVNAINSAVGRKVAFLGSITLTAEKNIHLKNSFSDLGVQSPVYLGKIPNVSGNWFFNFEFFKPSVDWTFCSLDEFYNTSSTATKSLQYSIYPPFITRPGTPKILTEDTYFSSIESNSIFQTASGNFTADGILATDKVLVVSGKNVGKINDVVSVSDTYLETSPFDESFSNGDRIFIYSSTDRPEITTNKLPQNYEGFCDPSSNLILYCSKDNLQDGYVQLYSSKEYFNFSTSNKTLHLEVDNEEALITFKEGSSDAQTVADEINGYFSNQVAFIDDSYIYIKGNYVNVFDCSSLSELDFPSGTYRQGLKVLVPDDYKFESGDKSFLNINIDNKDVQFVFINQNADLLITYTKQFLIDKINDLYKDKKVAFSAPGKMLLLGNSNITIREEISVVSLSRYDSGFTNFSNGADVWSKSLKLNESSTKFSVYGLDYFFKITEPNTLTTNFKIDPPTLTTAGQKRDPETGELYLETTFEYISLQGNFNLDGGYVVEVNGLDVYSNYDSWVYKLEDLTSGTNTVIAHTRDIFGQNSEELKFNVIFNDPQAVSAPEESGDLKWTKLASVTTLGDKKIEAMLQAIEDTFRPILTGLNALTELLKKLRAFITKYLGLDLLQALKRALQKFINDIINYMDQIINGEGLYVLNTLPTRNFLSKDTLTALEGGFDAFISKVVSSFDDELDSHRPILTEESQVGGMVFVASDTGGVNELLESMKTLMGIFTKDNPDFGLVPPENLKAIGENQRVAISWTMPMTSISPTGFYIYRSKNPGGTPRKMKTSGADFGPQKSGDLDSFEYNQQTGEIVTDYDCIGVLGEVSPIDVSNWSAPATSKDGDALPALAPLTGTAWWDSTLKVLRFQVVKDFLFIDGKKTDDETYQATANEQTFSEIVSGKVDMAVGFLDAIKGFSLVASQSNETSLVNGKTYFYKVVPAYVGTSWTGNSYEVVATPTAPNLISIEEDLSSQIKNIDTDGNSLNYTLSSSIFNKNKATYGSSFSDIEIFIDGAKIEPNSLDYKRGKIVLNERNQPRNNINVKYWGKQIKEATRAVIVGKEQGDFVIKRGANVDHESNKLVIQVGRGSNLPQVISEDLSGINIYQNVVLVRDFGTNADKTPKEQVTLTAEEVAARIRSQTSGINVRVNRLSQIVIEDAMNPDIYKGSYIKIHNKNPSLGFGYEQPNTESDAGASSGTPPNWYSIKPSDLFPVLNDILRYIQDTANKLLTSFENATKSLTDFIDLMIAKVEALSAMAQEIKDLLEKIANQMKLTAGLYYLNIPYKSGGLEYFKSALTSAIGKPEKSDYAGGIVVLYADGATTKAMNLIFGAIK